MKYFYGLMFAFIGVSANAGQLIANVAHGTDSVILRFPLYDAADPAACATDITEATPAGLEINVSTDVSDGYADTFVPATLEAITTIGTYATPTATFARFEIIATGSCSYELQLANALFDTVGANILTIEVTDGQTEIIDANYWVDLTPVTSTDLIASFLSSACTGISTPGQVGYQLCTVADAILVDTGTTLDTKVDTVISGVGKDTLISTTIDTLTSQRIFTLLDGSSDDRAYVGARVIITDQSNGEQKATGQVQSYTGSTKEVTLSYDPGVFTVVASDIVDILAER